MTEPHKKKYLSPFNAFMPDGQIAQKSIAPLYDTLSSEEAKNLAHDNPFSFLHVSKAEIDFSKDIEYNNPSVYDKAAENISNFIADGVFLKQEKQAYYIYQIQSGNHQQIGLVAICDASAVENNFIKSHEQTREAKETDRVKNIIAVNGSISPVMLIHKSNSDITKLLFDLIASSSGPDISATDQFNTQHNVYIINKLQDIELIDYYYNNLDNIDNIYVADGHHRTHAALRVAKELGHNFAAQKFLIVLFPQEQLNILGYHRIVKDLNNYELDEYLQIIHENFDVEQADYSIVPDTKNTFGMYLDKKWYKLTLKNNKSIRSVKFENFASSLDCSILNNMILEPLLNIKDIRTDPRIDFFGGSKPVKELEAIIDSYEHGVAFTLAPTTVQDIFDISDRNELMPPKSTWFYPKLCDGLFFYMFT